VEPKKPQRFRSGVLKTLPKDYVGERHVDVGIPHGGSHRRDEGVRTNHERATALAIEGSGKVAAG
jgi:hypothetical protein